MKDFIYKKLLVYFILLQPIIDMFTSYMVKIDLDLSIGIITKVFLMFLAGIYLVFYDKENRRFNYIYIFFLILLFGLNIYNNIDILEVRLVEYFNYFVKYIYHLLMLLFFIRWYKNYNIKLYQLRVPLLIIAFSFILSVVTDTAYLSYGKLLIKKGISGWYSSANELGNLVCLLFPVALYNAFHNKDGIFFDKVLFIICGIIMLSLGTKVGLLGYFCVLIFYVLIRLFMIKKKKLDKSFVLTLILIIGALMCYNYIPAFHNMSINMDKYGNMEDALLSGRDEYLKEMKQKRVNCNLFDIFVGKSFARDKDGSILIIEQDFYDIYFMYGIFGILLFIALYIKVYIMFFKKIRLYLKKPSLFSKKYFAVIVAVSLELCVAFISGHSLLSPSVSTYLVLLVAMSLNIDIYKNKNTKEKILISSKYQHIKLDPEQYDVTYLVFDSKKENLDNQTNLYYPYYKDYKILHKKFFRRIFFTKIVLFNLIRNQRYDIIVYDMEKDNKNFYLKIHHSKHKVCFDKKKSLINLLKNI